MTERPGERTSTRTGATRPDQRRPEPDEQTPGPGPAAGPTERPTGRGSSVAGGARSAVGTDTDRGGNDPDSTRAPLTQRVQARLNRATSEHRANAKPESRAAATKAARSGKPPRRARLRLSRIDPWSVMKTSFLLSVAFGVVTVVAVLMVWSVLGAAGVWDSINQTVQDVVGGQDSASTFDVQDYLGTSRIIGFTMLVAVIDVVLLTAIATLGAFLYNMAAALLGGVEVTLAEDER
jgi:hypothetical protein